MFGKIILTNILQKLVSILPIDKIVTFKFKRNVVQRKPNVEVFSL